MKVLHLTWLLSNGGGGIPPVVAALAVEQRRAGVDAIVAGVEDPRARAIVPSEVPVICERAVGPLALGFSPALARQVEAVRPDVIHLHGLFTWPSQIAKAWGRRPGRPVVIAPHGMIEPWALSNSAWKKRIFGALVENGNLARAACIHALSPDEAGHARSLGLRAPVALLPNGFDASNAGQRSPEEMRRLLPAIGERKVALYLGRVHPKKGLIPLVEAWAAFVRGGTSTAEPWVLVIGGPDQGGFEATIRTRVGSLGIENDVIFAGPRFGPEKSALLSGTDVFVLPSFSEGVPMALLEAMAWRIPVLATRACNVDVETPRAGILCEPEPRSIAAELGRMATAGDPERRAMGERGRREVETRYAWSRIAGSLVEVYAWLLGSGRRPECIQGSS